MSSPQSSSNRNNGSSLDKDSPLECNFSPSSDAFHPERVGTQRSTILVHQKSPLLVATPPQITRALAYSHPFLVPLNKLVGLLSWTTGDAWESFILVAVFWAVCLYGDVITRMAAPLVMVMALVLAMYIRRYSELSSTGWTGEKRKGHKRGASESNVSQHKSLEHIVETLRLFTSRCNILLDPFLRMTDLLSTQTTATAATTRPALTALFIRIVLVTPVWIVLALHPIHIITTKRVIMAVGTTVLTWHSQPARFTRALFWREQIFRDACSVVTGLDFDHQDSATRSSAKPKGLSKAKTPHEIAASLAAKNGYEAGIRLTFTLYENQRRWLGIGWSSSLLAYERPPWTDEHSNPTLEKDEFELPHVEGGQSKWIWAPGSAWHVMDNEGDIVPHPDESESGGGWIYYDNKVSKMCKRKKRTNEKRTDQKSQWQNGRKGKDGWGRYTRRRKWCRDAELVEGTEEDTETPPTPSTPLRMPTRHERDHSTTTTLVERHSDETQSIDTAVTSGKDDDANSSTVRRKKGGWFGRRASQPSSENSMARSSSMRSTLDDDEDDIVDRSRETDRSSWGVGDDVQMGFG
jgi:hypothetical protein